MLESLMKILGGSLERAPWGWALLATVLLALIKVWPILQLQVTKAREQLRKERRDDLHSCREELAAMSTRMDAVEQRAHMLEIKLNGALMAYKILDADITMNNPHSSALMQARAALTVAFEISPTPPDMRELLSHVDDVPLAN